MAALVTENLPNRVTARFWPFAGQPQPPFQVQLRVWRCHGTFKITLASDTNNDGVGEAVLWETERALTFGDYLDLNPPPRQGSVLTIAPLQVTEPDFTKADPAISRLSVEPVYGGHLVVKVYNNGRKPIPEGVLVRVRDRRTGDVIIGGEQRTAPIEAPLDLVPRWQAVEFKNFDLNTYDTVIIEIDPERQVDDFNRHNNRVELTNRSTFALPLGWQ
jgi:hypothetical protein